MLLWIIILFMIFGVFDLSPLKLCINCGFWATVCKTVRPLLSDRCPVLSVLSVTFVHCGQTVGRIKTKLFMQVGLVPGHIAVDGDPAPPPQKGSGAVPQIFGPCLLRPNGWMDEAGTWHGGRPQLRRLCVRRDPVLFPQKGARVADMACGQKSSDGTAQTDAADKHRKNYI